MPCSYRKVNLSIGRLLTPLNLLKDDGERGARNESAMVSMDFFMARPVHANELTDAAEHLIERVE